MSCIETLQWPRPVQGPFGAGEGPLTLERAWPRDRDRILLEYTAPAGVRVAGQWFRDRDRLRRVARKTGEAAASADHVAVDERAGVMLQARGADRSLTRLADAVSDPGSALVSHRPERRAVVRLELPRGPAYAKFLRPHRILAALRHGAHAQRIPGIRTPRLLATDVEAGLLLWSSVEGSSLYDLSGSDALIEAAGLAGAALRCIHERAPIPDPAACGRSDEMSAVQMWLDRLAAFLPDRYRAASPAGRRVLAALASTDSGTALLHRDFHDKQVLLGSDRTVGVIDFDTMAVGDPALDIANLLSHLELRVLQRRCQPARAAAAAEAFVAGYGAERALTKTLEAYVAAARLRLFCVYSFRPRWAQKIRPLLERGSSPFELAPE